ncbi:MAG: hypothetical protein WC876_10820 [Candidatus Thermoplasmatota archaeon]|jgi:hypothetical protein
MRARLAVALALLAAVPLAGCLSDDAPSGAVDGRDADGNLVFRADWAEHALPYSDHDHFDAAQHQGLSTPNFDERGWDPLISAYYGRSAGGYLCGDSVDTGDRRLAAVHGINTDVAFELVDVTDADHPALLGEFIMPRSASRDVALTPDGTHVAIAISTPDANDGNYYASTATTPEELALDAAGTAYWRAPCNDGPVPVGGPADLMGLASALGLSGPEQDAPWPPGVMLVSVADPAAPTFAGYYALPVLGAHSVYAGELDGRTLVIASVVNLVAATSNFWFFEVGEQGLVLLSQYVERADTAGAPLINGHNDAVVQQHPITGQPLAYLANWHQGVTILDLTDPRLPVRLSNWNDSPGVANSDLVQDGSGNVHEAIPIQGTWGGKHYMIVGQEILDHPGGTPSGLVYVIDTTDPAQPKEVATWTLPVDVVWSESAVFSTHYVSVYNMTIFVAHYHAGVWAVDLSGLADGVVDEADEHPPAIGAYIPANVSPQPPPDGSYDWTPTIMDANVLGNGDLVIWDCTSGIYVVRFDATQPAPARTFEGWNDPLA